MDCPFCDIESEKYRIIYNGELVVAFLSNPHLMPGHTLVSPKRHVENIAELTTDEWSEISTVLVGIEKKILTFAEGCDLRQNYRPFLKQSDIKIDHLHFHLLPRFNEDEMFYKSQIKDRELFKPLTDEEVKKFGGLVSLG